MRTTFVIFLLMSAHWGYTQTGPGGVGNNIGSSSLTMWLDANTLQGYTNNDEVHLWRDQSGYDNHATPNTDLANPNTAPNYSAAGGGNSMPTITFDGVNNDGDALEVTGNAGTLPTTELTVFWVGTYEDGDDWCAVLFAGDDDNWDDGWGWARDDNEDFAVGWVKEWDINEVTFDINIPPPAWGDVNIWGMIYDAGDNRLRGYRNENLIGNVLQSGGGNDVLTYDNNDNENLLIGRSFNRAEHFEGTISEIILFNVDVNDAQRIIINNYLSAKYDVTILAGNDVYDEDDALNGNYDYEVAGIGQAADGSNQTESQGTSIVRILDAQDLENGEFFMWGHDNGTLLGTEIVDLPAAGESVARLDRVWAVSETGGDGDVGSIDVRFDLADLGPVNPDELRLLIDDDGVFTNATEISGATLVSEAVYEFTDVTDLDDGEKFTLASADIDVAPLYLSTDDRGPGGVGDTDGNSNLTLWLDASAITDGVDGADLTLWEDLSGNNNDAFPLTAAPDYVEDGGANTNNLPAVSFDNTVGGSEEDMFVSTNSGVKPTTALSVFVVGSYEDLSDTWGSFINASDDDAWNDGWGIGQDANTGNMMYYADDYLGNVCTENIAADYGTTHIWSMVYDPSLGANQGRGYKSENSCNFTFAGPLDYNGGESFQHLLIGTGPDNNGPNYYLLGEISEIILFNTNVNQAQRIIISNYLAAKYDIALANFDWYDEDDAVNGDFDHDVAGIGRRAGEIHSESRGTGIVSMSLPSTAGLSNNEFLFWGHDNGLLRADDYSDVPAGVLARLVRLWRVSERGGDLNVGNVDIRFDLSDFTGPVQETQLRLLVDTDGTFSDATVISGASYVEGKTYEFSNVSQIVNGRYFTLGTTSFNTPLPIELVSFTATVNGTQVDLDWITGSETNNDFFTVERSRNGVDWESVVEVDGAGDSNVALTYRAVDTNPYDGLSYYRLKQTDFDGQFSHSSVVSVNLEKNTEDNALSLYPNPAQDLITIEAPMEEFEFYRVYNVLGQDMTAATLITDAGGSGVSIRVSNLLNGIYTIQTKSAVLRFVKE